MNGLLTMDKKIEDKLNIIPVTEIKLPLLIGAKNGEPVFSEEPITVLVPVCKK